MTLIGDIASKTTVGDGAEFFGLPLIAQDEDTLSASDNICVGTLGKRLKAEQAGGTATNGVQAILVFAAPSVDEFLASEDESVKTFVAKLIEREATDVAYGKIRGSETLAQLETAFGSIPATVLDVVTTSRESSAADTSTFDNMWGPFRTGFIKVKAPALFDKLPQKQIVLKAMRSKSYALANPQTKAIEEAGFFTKLLGVMIQLAPEFKDEKGVAAPQDTDLLESWLATRDSVNLEYKVETVATADQFAGIEF
jgi:hypothetical protein